MLATDVYGASAAGKEKEVFNYNNVAADMNKICGCRDNAKKTLDSITDLLDTTITNKENSEDQVLGGSIGPLWDKWNAFSLSFVEFVKYIEQTREMVAGSGTSASSTNQSYETTIATTVNTMDIQSVSNE